MMQMHRNMQQYLRYIKYFSYIYMYVCMYVCMYVRIYVYIYIYISVCVCVCVCVCMYRLCFFVWIMNNKVFSGNQQWRMNFGPTVWHYLSAFIVRLGDDDGRCLCRPTVCCRQRQNLKFHEHFDQLCYNVLPKQESAPFNYPLICAATWPQSLLINYKAANDRTFKGCIEKANLFKKINKNKLYIYFLLTQLYVTFHYYSSIG
jgi:hypothetical protein